MSVRQELLGDTVVDYSDRREVTGVELLKPVDSGSAEYALLEGGITWEQYEAEIRARLEANPE